MMVTQQRNLALNNTSSSMAPVNFLLTSLAEDALENLCEHSELSSSALFKQIASSLRDRHVRKKKKENALALPVAVCQSLMKASEVYNQLHPRFLYLSVTRGSIKRGVPLKKDPSQSTASEGHTSRIHERHSRVLAEQRAVLI